MIDSVEEHKEYVAKCTELNEILVNLDYTRESLNSWFKEIKLDGVCHTIKILFSNTLLVSYLKTFTNEVSSFIQTADVVDINNLLMVEEKLKNEKFNKCFKFVSNYLNTLFDKKDNNTMKRLEKRLLDEISQFDNVSSCLISSNYLKDMIRSFNKLEKLLDEVKDTNVKNKLKSIISMLNYDDLDTNIIPLININDLTENVESIIPTKASLEEGDKIRNFFSSLEI